MKYKVLENYLNALLHDNATIVYRGNRFGRTIEEKVFPKYLEAVGKWDLHSEILSDLETKYQKKLKQPASIYKADRLKEFVFKFLMKRPDRKLDIPSPEKWPSKPGLTFEQAIDGKDLSTNSGLPLFKSHSAGGKKAALKDTKDRIARKEPYLETVVGYRTQQSAPGEEKVRPINIVPFQYVAEEWMFCRPIVDSIPSNWQKIGTFACTPKALYKYWVDDLSPRGHLWTEWDWSQFDAHVNAELIGWYMEGLPERMVRYAQTATILTPWGDIQKKGGVLSGQYLTHPMDDRINEGVSMDLFPKSLQFRNGDNIILSFASKPSDSGLKEIQSRARRRWGWETDVKGLLWSKDEVWFSKLLLSPKFEGALKPVGLVLNRLAYMERESDPEFATRYYQAIAILQILNYLEFHPYGKEVVKWVVEVDKHPYTELDQSKLKEAFGLWKQRHRYQSETEQLEVDTPEKLFDTFAAREVANLV